MTDRELDTPLGGGRAARASEDEFRAVFQRVPVGVAVLDSRTGRFIEVNPAYAEIAGYTVGELLSTDFQSITHPDDVADDLSNMDRLRRGEIDSFEMEKRYYRSDRSTVWVHLTVAPLSRVDGELRRHLAVVHDVSARKRAEEDRARLEEQLQHARKVEALGTLAGGVAHDFNNILGGVLAGLSLLELRLGRAGLAPAHVEDLRAMQGLVQRGAELSRQLLGLARRGRGDVRPLDLARVVASTSDLFALTRRDIALSRELSPDLPAALVDHAQIEQVLLNLFANAGQAMPDGGSLTVRASAVDLAEPDAAPFGARPGAFIRVEVADTGVGMDPSTKARIFEPFFTTKAAGHGTGLGLASAYATLKNHGGFITVESELGRGTTFALYVPAAPAAATPEPSSRGSIRAGRGTILVVDDEAVVRELTARLLRAMGYEALTAAGGREAVERLRAHEREVSLVILDLTMPEMSGARTFEALREVSPSLKVLLCSGYSIEGPAQELLARGAADFIQKPFDAATLSARVQALLP